MQCLAEVLGAVEAVRLQHLLEPAVEPLDHAIGARRTRLGQLVLDVQAFAQKIELVLARVLNHEQN
jgi:hypothetical protein